MSGISSSVKLPSWLKDNITVGTSLLPNPNVGISITDILMRAVSLVAPGPSYHTDNC
jgi:hypothetical protein